MRECSQCRNCFEDEIAVCPEDAVTLQYTLPGSVQITEKHRLEKLIARASMGSVYSAFQQDLQRRVAIKALNPQLLASNIARERFRREALAAAGLKHPNIVTVYDFGSNPYGLFYIVMELLEGRTLADRLAQEKRLDTTEAVRIALEICSALEQAHSSGIIHRDLKPSNIFLCKTPAGDLAKVIDFGLVKLKERADAFKSITAGALIGSLHYSAPEQYRSSDIDARADIYSLGALLYHMLTGRTPFNAPTKTEVVYQQMNAKPTPPHRIVFDIPPEIESAALKALEKDPASRHQSIADFARALRSAPKRGARRTVGMFLSKPLARSAEQARNEFQQAGRRILRFEHFIGRRREIGKLKQAYEQSLLGRSSAVLVTGDPGIGKTLLLAQCIKEFASEGALCFKGRFADSPAAPWSLTDLRDHLAHMLEGEAHKFDAVFGSAAPFLKEVLSTGTAAPKSTAALVLPDQIGASERSVELLAQAYIALSEHQPIVVALDDLHSADEANLDFLIYLTGAASNARMLFLFTAESQAASREESRLPQWLDRLSSRRQLLRLALEPLSAIETRALVEKIFDPAAVSEEAVSKLRQVTEGNPLHLVSLLQLMADQRQIIWDDKQWLFCGPDEIKIPPTVARLIEARLNRLSDESRAALEKAALLGETFSFDALKRFAALDEDRLLQVVDEALGNGVLAESRTPEGASPQDDYYSFAQHTLHQVLYENRSAEERAEMHKQAAAIAAEEAGETGIWQNIEAARHFLLAGDRAEAFCRHVAASSAVWRTGEPGLSRRYLENATPLAENLFGIGDSFLSENAVKSLMMSGKTAEENSRLLSHFCDYLMLSVDLKLCGDPAQAEHWLESALLLAERVGEPTLVARALVASGHYQQNQGDYTRALNYFERALSIYEETGNKRRYNVIAEQLVLLKARVKPQKPTADIL